MDFMIARSGKSPPQAVQEKLIAQFRKLHRLLKPRGRSHPPQCFKIRPAIWLGLKIHVNMIAQVLRRMKPQRGIVVPMPIDNASCIIPTRAPTMARIDLRFDLT